MQPAGDEIIRLLDLKSTDTVLDIASGSGEPAISISKIVIQGKVIGSDLSQGMLEIARQKANTQHLSNIAFLEADVSNLPFEDETFNAVSCRFGFMFFADMHLAAKQMFRVLKNGGKMATSVWNMPEKNFWVTVIMDAIGRNIEITPPPVGTPSMFRCAKNGLMEEILTKAGFQNIQIKEAVCKLRCLTADGYWNFMNDLAAPVVAALSTADDKTVQNIKEEVFAAIKQKFGVEEVVIDAGFLVLSGEK